MGKVAVIVLGMINALRHLVQGGVPSLISLANLKAGGVEILVKLMADDNS